MERKTRIWIGLGTALLVGSAGGQSGAMTRETAFVDATPKSSSTAALTTRPRMHTAQVEASGEGGPGEGGGPVLGTITEFRLSSNDASAFAYDAATQVSGYVDLVSTTYANALDAATSLRDAIGALTAEPSPETLDSARSAWLAARAAYLETEAFLFYAGPVDGPGGPFPRLNAWPVEPATINGLIADTAQSLNFRALARLNTIEAPRKITTGLHVLEYLLWGQDGQLTSEEFAADSRQGDYAEALGQLFVNDLSVVTTAWARDANNYRASVEAMDQRNALGRAFNGMTVLLGYELPLRRLGAGLFPANENFQASPFSDSSAEDNRFAFNGARKVYFDSGLDALVEATDAELATKIATEFEAAETALAALDAPYERFLASPTGSAERATVEAAIRALTTLALDLRLAGNRLGILVVVPGM